MNIKIERVSRYSIIFLLVFIIFFTPWEALKGGGFQDLQNYIDYFKI